MDKNNANINNNAMSDLMGVTMDKIRNLVDVNTIVGQPVKIDEGTSVVPISKVNFGFATGGTNYGKQAEATPLKFGGGSGAGVNITPIAFLVFSNGDVRIMPVPIPASNTSDRIIEMVPDVLNKIDSFINKKDKNDIDE